jgi:hypothetical protein
MKNMSNDNQVEVSSKKKDVNNKRATLLKIGVAIPAIVTLSSRPAYGAGFCSLSGFASVNASGVTRHANKSCGGYSQGGWKTAYGSGDGNWASDAPGCKPNPKAEYDFHYNSSRLIQATKSALNNEKHCNNSGKWKSNGSKVCADIIGDRAAYGTTSFNSVFSSGLKNSMQNRLTNAGWPVQLIFSLHDALLYGDTITREAAAAYLNAKAAENGLLPDFHFTTAQVQDLYNQGYSWVNGNKVPANPLSRSEFVALFQAAQH